MTEEQIIKKLKDEGYDKVWTYDAEVNEIDEEHSHDFDSKLHVLSGEIRITLANDAIADFRLREGQEIEIPRNAIHSARVGNQGCRYVVAEKY